MKKGRSFLPRRYHERQTAGFLDSYTTKRKARPQPGKKKALLGNVTQRAIPEKIKTHAPILFDFSSKRKIVPNTKASASSSVMAYDLPCWEKKR